MSSYTFLTANERQTMLERLLDPQLDQQPAHLPLHPGASRQEGKLAVHGAWFDISTGELWVMDSDTGDFVRPEA